MVVHTVKRFTGNEVQELAGRVRVKINQQEGTWAALKMLEALWMSADAETKQRAERWSGWESWKETLRRAVDWA